MATIKLLLLSTYRNISFTIFVLLDSQFYPTFPFPISYRLSTKKMMFAVLLVACPLSFFCPMCGNTSILNDQHDQAIAL